MQWYNDFPEDIQQFIQQLKKRPRFAEELAKFGHAVYQLYQKSSSKKELGEKIAVKALEMEPDNLQVRFHAEWALKKKVPGWHFGIINDQMRNDTYDRALREFIKPNSIVLEIGTGTGLLAMMAARAGAKKVYTCEMEPLIAQAARENILKNNLQDQISVIQKKSTELRIGEDLPERADVLVSEITNSGLLGEDVLPVMEDAMTRLVKKNAVLLPRQIAVQGVLISEISTILPLRDTQDINGFDLSAFNRFKPLTCPIDRTSLKQVMPNTLSAPLELLRFDFTSQKHFTELSKTVKIPVSRTGKIYGLVKWIHLQFTEDLIYENRPPLETCWAPILHLFPKPISVEKGQLLPLCVVHKQRDIRIYPADRSIVLKHLTMSVY